MRGGGWGNFAFLKLFWREGCLRMLVFNNQSLIEKDSPQ